MSVAGRWFSLGLHLLNTSRSVRRFSRSSGNMFAVIQLASTNNKSENLAKIVDMITEAANEGAKVTFLTIISCFITDDISTRSGRFHRIL